MRRKIPGRKHHGVRDPEKQRATRLNSIKNKINAPPTNPDEQQIPKSLTRIIELQNRVKNGEFSGKRKKKPANRIKPFQQLQGESDSKFMYRVNRICEEVKHEAAFEKKYGVEVKRNKETGEVEDVVKRPKDELTMLLKKARKEKKGKKSKVTENQPKLTKSQKRQLKLSTKKERKTEEKLADFEQCSDEVKFGEVVHAPPSLTAPKKVAQNSNAARPGKRELLLKSLLKPNDEGKKVKEDKLRITSNKVIDRKGKRKDMPNSMRRQLDKQQKEIIEAYKTLKAQKYKKK